MHKKLLIPVVAVLLVALSASAQTTVLCESQDGRMRECNAGTGFVSMARQISDSACTLGTSWGYRDGKIWVSNGCRAEFNVVPRTFVTCESINGQPGRCFTDTTEGVRLVRRISDSGCAFGKDWGYDTNGIWVANGCRAEFAVRPTQATMTSSTTNVQPATILCESENNTRKWCRTDTRWGVTLVRQVSENDCIRNKSWGYDKDGIWVTNGCRGEFTLGESGNVIVASNVAPIVVQGPPQVVTVPGPTKVVTVPGPTQVVTGPPQVVTVPSAPQVVAVPTTSRVPTIMCESIDGRRNHCDVDTSFGVRLLRQTSDSNCQFNSTWGVDGNGIWVTNGCRGEFALGEAQGSMTSSSGSTSVICESKDGQRTVCPADTSMGVAVVRQVSDAACRLNSTWGFDQNGIWVTSGCRAEFILRK